MIVVKNNQMENNPITNDGNNEEIDFNEYMQMQMREALGPDNRWFCSQYYGYEVTDENKLIAYYIKYGGAKDFYSKHPRRKQK
jgi:hypothetical protein